MRIDLRAPKDVDVYSLLVGTVAPRPIGWISTMSKSGTRNLAPFSYFGLASDAPPLFFLSVGRRDGHHKDTSRNLLDVQEAVVHLVEVTLAQAMVNTGKDVEPEIDEFTLANVDHIASDVIAPVRLRDAAIAYECRLYRHVEIGDGPNDLFLLEGLVAHIRDDLLSGTEPPAQKVGLLGRLGGSDYVVVTETIKLRRR